MILQFNIQLEPAQHDRHGRHGRTGQQTDTSFNSNALQVLDTRLKAYFAAPRSCQQRLLAFQASRCDEQVPQRWLRAGEASLSGQLVIHRKLCGLLTCRVLEPPVWAMLAVLCTDPQAPTQPGICLATTTQCNKIKASYLLCAPADFHRTGERCSAGLRPSRGPLCLNLLSQGSRGGKWLMVRMTPCLASRYSKTGRRVSRSAELLWLVLLAAVSNGGWQAAIKTPPKWGALLCWGAHTVLDRPVQFRASTRAITQELPLGGKLYPGWCFWPVRFGPRIYSVLRRFQRLQHCSGFVVAYPSAHDVKSCKV